MEAGSRALAALHLCSGTHRRPGIQGVQGEITPLMVVSPSNTSLLAPSASLSRSRMQGTRGRQPCCNRCLSKSVDGGRGGGGSCFGVLTMQGIALCTNPCPSHEACPLGGGGTRWPPPPNALALVPLPFLPSLHPPPLPWSVAPMEPLDFPCFIPLCQAHTEEGNGPRHWPGASRQTSRAGGARTLSWALGCPPAGPPTGAHNNR